MRIESLAEADGTRVLDDRSTIGTLMPMVVRAGLVHMRESSEPEPIVETPSSRPDSSRSRSSREVEVGGLAGLQPGHGDVALVVVQGRDEADQRGDGVGDRAAEHARVDAVVERRTVTTTRMRPRSVVVSAGVPMSQFIESARTMASARSLSPWRSRMVEERVGADLLLPLDEDRDATGRLPAWARSAATWAMIPALSSAAPRP